MSDQADTVSREADVVARYWAACEARDWVGFAALLAEDVVYELPQTRERIQGRDRYVEFNASYPGDWHVRVERTVGGGGHGASWTRFAVDGDEQPGLCFFDFDGQGRIAQITDFWPTPYEPPPGREHLTERF
ncbi:MAG: nuclear transport factor 2 family protein [Micromonosporaceae bacterium]